MEGVPQRALLVTPHPDDAESGCGGTAAKWIAAGAEVYYLICTNGDKGSGDPDMASDKLAAIREKEQLDAAQALGVKDVIFLKHPDGTLEDDHQLRSEVVRAIRKYRPDTVMCMDPYRSRGPHPSGPPGQRTGGHRFGVLICVEAYLLSRADTRRETLSPPRQHDIPLGKRGARSVRGYQRAHR